MEPEDLLLEETFQAAAKFLPSILTKVGQDDLLYFYARYKQATVGPCDTAKPGFFDFQGKHKWEAWKSIESMTKETAMKEYVEKMTQVHPEWIECDPDDVKEQSWISVSSLVKPQVKLEDQDFLYHVQEGNLKEVCDYLKENSKLASELVEDLFPIHWAADRGNAEMVKMLLDFGADVDAQDEDGQTALHYACSNEHESVVKVLLAASADINIIDNENMKPLDVLKNDAMKNTLFS